MSIFVLDAKSLETRVLHVCVSSGLGGLELYSLQLHQMFLQDGIPCLHICEQDSLFEHKLVESKLKCVGFNKSGYFSLTNILRFRKILVEKNIEAIVVHHLRDLWFIVPAMLGLKNIRLVGIAQMFLRNVNKKDFLHRKLYGRLDVLLALTKTQRISLLNCLPIDKDKVLVIPNSVNMDKFKKINPGVREDLRSNLNLEESHTLIGIVGRIDPWKGQLELLEAFQKIQESFPKLRLLIIGEETPGEIGYKNKILQFVKNENILDKVIFLNFQENVHEWMTAMDIFVMPSYEEAFGIVLVEAMAAGLPCISTKAGGVPDIIISEELGVLVEPKSSHAIEKAITFLIQKPELAKQMGKRAQAYAFEKYDLNKVYLDIKAQVLCAPSVDEG